jgi:TatD DNase family protein
MNFIDTHTHIYLKPFDEDRNAVIERAKANHLTKLLVPDIDSSERSKMLEICRQYSDICFPMLGIHPTSVKADYENELSLLRQDIKKNACIAIGECGLDYFWDKTFIEEQKKVLIEQFILASQYNLPIVIHSRKSLQDLLSLIKAYKYLNLRGVFHCYPGNVNEAKVIMDAGFYLGIGGVVTYKNASMADVVKYAPLENLLLETDSPYLPPVPHRGQRNESAYIPIIAAKIAELKNISLEEVSTITTGNATKLFKISGF